MLPILPIRSSTALAEECSDGGLTTFLHIRVQSIKRLADVLLCAVLASGLTAAYAQETDAPATMMPPGLEQLNLNDQQKAQIRQLMSSAREKSKPLMSELRQIHTQTHKEVEAVLTPEQLELHRQFQAEMRAMHPGPMFFSIPSSTRSL
ncbi:MAG: hypothetical protein H7Y22_00270 [Gemmatimonadaceae bacterium]|nr:hypothetical protein [Gloeobacterales cyanobacterium ES-bin-141]